MERTERTKRREGGRKAVRREGEAVRRRKEKGKRSVSVGNL